VIFIFGAMGGLWGLVGGLSVVHRSVVHRWSICGLLVVFLLIIIGTTFSIWGMFYYFFSYCRFL